MKKLALLLLMLFCAAGTLRAQNVKSDVMSYLRNEGYAPSYDEDGDVKFKVQGYTYYVLSKDSGMGYTYVEVRIQFATDRSVDELVSLANDYNHNKYICKYVAYPDSEGDGVFQISMEFITSSTAQTNYQMGHALRLLPSEAESFVESL
ncbi:YbjN domain-containing protein [uncultured Alistipes sp.]|jgi:hypothetical protein|uniref:YbjN domain-containing protein n=1 Tax=uncultured Alistipes sp. TaxID=538949 RepID=UPI001FA3AB34|nr:YbjN domain-containing protein [uncultured Alistipes sp.]HJC18137.1 YbjN domain-containing protein [Candidatus Alistipes stercorigallinarum]